MLAINHAPDVLQLLDMLLTEEGYRVSTQSHLERDLELFDALAPDLIVIDYMWPDVDDNWSLLQLLRLNPSTRSTPIVLCTGALTEATSLHEHLNEMKIEVVLKPFDIDKLLLVISSALERHTG